jgi:hypothetical protein
MVRVGAVMVVVTDLTCPGQVVRLPQCILHGHFEAISPPEFCLKFQDGE